MRTATMRPGVSFSRYDIGTPVPFQYTEMSRRTVRSNGGGAWCLKWSSACLTQVSRCSRSAPLWTTSARGPEDLAQVTLMSDGVSVYECTSPDEVVDLLAGGQGVFGIALGRVWHEVGADLAELPTVRAEEI